MNWVKLTSDDDLPIDGNVFLIKCKESVSMAQYNKNEECFYFIFNPAKFRYPSLKMDWRITLHIDHWMPIPLDVPE